MSMNGYIIVFGSNYVLVWYNNSYFGGGPGVMGGRFSTAHVCDRCTKLLSDSADIYSDSDEQENIHLTKCAARQHLARSHRVRALV